MSYQPRPSRSCVYPVTSQTIRDPDVPNSEATQLEFSIHKTSIPIKRELKSVIPAVNLNDEIFIIPTFQYVKVSLSHVTDLTELEKNRLLENFAGWSKLICQYLIGKGFFADFIDPCTGFPSISRQSSSVFSEVDSAAALLNYRTEQVGFCNLVLHPKWGSACYPASIVVNANIDAIIEAIEKTNRRWKVNDSSEQQQKQNQTGDENKNVTDQQQSSNTGATNKDIDDSKAGGANDSITPIIPSRLVLRVSVS